jgi:hypothetical protein
VVDVLWLLGTQGAFGGRAETVAMQLFCGPTHAEKNQPGKEAALVPDARLP